MVWPVFVVCPRQLLLEGRMLYSVNTDVFLLWKKHEEPGVC